MPERAVEIVVGLHRSTFACHETVYTPQPRDAMGRFASRQPQQHCAGALLLMAHDGWQGDMQQIAMRLGLYDPSRLDMNAPVYRSTSEMLTAYGSEVQLDERSIARLSAGRKQHRRR